jgi:hypothetical protein
MELPLDSLCLASTSTIQSHHDTQGYVRVVQSLIDSGFRISTLTSLSLEEAKLSVFQLVHLEGLRNT